MTAPEAERVALAEQTARTLTRRWGGRHDWRELLGACWEGIDRAAGRGAGGGPYLRAAAHHAAVDYSKSVGRQRRRIVPLSLMDCDGTDDESDYGGFEPATEDRPDPDRRLLALWCETRAARAGWPPRQRVMVYLYAVEGMTLAEIGAAFGLCKAAVHAAISERVGPLRGTGGDRSGDRRRTRQPKGATG